MTNENCISDIRERINNITRRNNDRGYISWSGCDRICAEIFDILQETEKCPDQGVAFDIYILILNKMMKLISYADTSSGAATDVITACQNSINEICRSAEEENKKYFFDTIIKTVQKNVFDGWPDDILELLTSAVYFVCDKKRAGKIFDNFPKLETLYRDNPYPKQLIITLSIIERLEGDVAADKYLMEHIDVPELRIIAVEKALDTKDYIRAENLCLYAVKENIREHFNIAMPWSYYLERLYRETGDQKKLTETVRSILLQRDTSYFRKLKDIYQNQGIWEEKKEPLWQELCMKLPVHQYALLSAQENEMEKLLEAVRRNPSSVMDHGKQLASRYPEETYNMYEEYILKEAQESTDRRRYRQVCRMIKQYSEAGAKEKAIELIDRLMATYPRRPAMQEELIGQKRKLEKKPAGKNSE